MLVMGDALAMALVEARHFTRGISPNATPAVRWGVPCSPG